MRQAGLIENTRRGYFRITQRGLELAQTGINRIDLNVLGQFPEYQEFRLRKRVIEESVALELGSESSRTPDELMDDADREIREALANDLLQKLKACSPGFFENLVVDVLVKMGYGGTLENAGQAIGKSGDEGIDGIINEDRLGLDLIYIQAKKWEGNVSRPDIQKFAGALQGKRAKKGVFITTSDFSREAREYVNIIDTKIVLMNGYDLARWMIEYNVGV